MHLVTIFHAVQEIKDNHVRRHKNQRDDLIMPSSTRRSPRSHEKHDLKKNLLLYFRLVKCTLQHTLFSTILTIPSS